MDPIILTSLIKVVFPDKYALPPNVFIGNA